MKKGQLYAYHMEISEWLNSGSVLYYFNRSRINDFYKEHSARIEKLMKEIREFQLHYFVFENDTIKKGEDGQSVMLDGKTQADANEAWGDLMNQQIAEGLKLIRP